MHHSTENLDFRGDRRDYLVNAQRFIREATQTFSNLILRPDLPPEEVVRDFCAYLLETLSTKAVEYAFSRDSANTSKPPPRNIFDCILGEDSFEDTHAR